MTAIEIQARSHTFALKKGPTDWELTAPRQEKADAISVQSFLSRIDSLQTSEFLEPKQGSSDRSWTPPCMTIKIWQGRAGPVADDLAARQTGARLADRHDTMP